ncbi:MAG: acyloxyacyl hydrolase [Allorhizobium sp.]
MRYFVSAAVISFLFFSTSSLAADPASPAVLPDDATPLRQTDTIFDELRFGVLTSADNSETNEEDGQFITGMLFFDPWGHREAQGFDRLLRPRIHVGGTVATEDEANQVYAGLSWTADLNERFFLELGFGGTVHDGDLDANDGGDGPKLGCRTLFHEYVAAGLNFTERWSVIAHMEHSSHANLCDGPNNGLSRAGVMVAYKF